MFIISEKTHCTNSRESRGVNFDLAVYKAFDIVENMNLQFRAEAFNTLNTPEVRK